MKQASREVILGRNQAIALFVGGVIALILVFVLGVLFGKNMAGRSEAREQSQAAAEALSPEKPGPAPSTTAATALARGETAIQQKIAEQKPPAELSKVAKGETASKTKTSKPSALQTAKATETAKAPAAKTTETKPKETAPSAQKEAWLIQVASFPDKASADQLVARLKSGKWPAYDAPAQVPGKGTYSRVYLGTYTSKEQAGKALIIFKSRETEYKDAFVIKK